MLLKLEVHFILLILDVHIMLLILEVCIMFLKIAMVTMLLLHLAMLARTAWHEHGTDFIYRIEFILYQSVSNREFL